VSVVSGTKPDDQGAGPVDNDDPARVSNAGGVGDDDATRVSDISYYRDSALAKLLTTQAAERARRARREAIVLLPLVVLVIVLWALREELFGTDVPVRIAAAVLLAAIGWRFARDLGRVLGPRLLARSDPGTASTVAFLVQLLTLVAVAVVALRLVDLDPRAIALGGAVTAVVLGLAAQSTLGNLIAGIVLITARPFRVGERVRMQGGTLGGEVEGTVATIGLIYTTLARGAERLLVPNNSVLGASVVPLRQPAGVDLQARLRPGVKPSELQKLLKERVETPTRDEPHISLQEVYGDYVRVRITATPAADVDGAKLADEVLAAVSAVAASSPTASSDETGARELS
jgi:small-conductance mechanosensitive channel